jgi:hypothetical protein
LIMSGGHRTNDRHPEAGWVPVRIPSRRPADPSAPSSDSTLDISP